MRLALLLLAGCAGMKSAQVGPDPLRLEGAWIGLDDRGAHWWRLSLVEGQRGRGAFESDGAVARYRVTDWSGDEEGAVRVHLARDAEATALDAAPRAIPLAGTCDGTRLRLTYGTREIVFLREDQLIPACKRLKARMEAE